MHVRHTLNRADAVAFDQGSDDLGAAFKREAVHWLGLGVADFRRATDILLARVTLEDIALEMGVSVQALRQARVATDSASYRSPPDGREEATRALAAQRVKQLEYLIKPTDKRCRKMRKQ